MRKLSELDQFRRTDDARVVEVYGGNGHDEAGLFDIPCGLFILRVIATTGDGWDHVSVSARNRCPYWEEMEFVKRLFFRTSEVAMQLHVKPEDHVNNHPYTLHLWRCLTRPVPLPPKWMV